MKDRPEGLSFSFGHGVECYNLTVTRILKIKLAVISLAFAASCLTAVLAAGPSYDLADPGIFSNRFLGPPGSELGNGVLRGHYTFDLGDLNGDGIRDIAMGAKFASTAGRIQNGAVYVVYGPLPSGPDQYHPI